LKLHRVLPQIATDARAAIVTGDAGRIPVFARLLGTATRTWQTRELVVTEVQSDGEPILIACHGQGGFSTAILAEELIDSGVRSLIRIGSCGTLQPSISRGTVVLSTGCVRDDGTSASYLPLEVPTVPDAILLRLICEALERQNTRYVLGLTHCKDSYYSADPARKVRGRNWPERYEALTELGVAATEAEAAALFSVATVRGVVAAGMFVVGAAADPNDKRMAECAVAALSALRRLPSRARPT
jgi:uridine phosphorylase